MAKSKKKQPLSLSKFDPTKANFKIIRTSLRLPKEVSKELTTISRNYNKLARKNKKKTISMNSLMISALVRFVNTSRTLR